MNFLLISIILTFLFTPEILSKTAEEWKSRSIYQIITDRFARTDGSTQDCQDIYNYCGGTFKGIQNNLDYVQGMGFDAIWISPVVANTPGGYHGYWVRNLYEVNEYFGTPEELHELIQACHERDIWVMVDIVANHVGYVDNWNYSTIVPFNDASHYNKYSDCALVDPKNQDLLETCWLSGLPDLDQNHPFVKETLLSWATEFIKQYDIDALRIDTVPHVSKSFWKTFSKAVGVYTIGEVLNFDLHYLAGYQGPVDGVLNYALYSAVRNSFQNGGSMHSIESYYEDSKTVWADMTLLGNFVNNHDNPRFLNSSQNLEAFKSALAFSIGSVGIPMVYYGDEQAYSGGADPANREALWPSMNRDSDIYHFLKTINQFRKSSQFYRYDQVQRYVDESFYAFTRGDYFFAFTNSNEYQSRMINFHPYAEGTRLCNIFHQEDCVEVIDGQFPAVLLNGEVKIFAPAGIQEKEPEGIEKIWEKIKMVISDSIMTGVNNMDSSRM